MTVSKCNEETQQANLFELRGYDIQITYSTTAINIKYLVVSVEGINIKISAIA